MSEAERPLARGADALGRNAEVGIATVSSNAPRSLELPLAHRARAYAQGTGLYRGKIRATTLGSGMRPESPLRPVRSAGDLRPCANVLPNGRRTRLFVGPRLFHDGGAGLFMAQMLR